MLRENKILIILMLGVMMGAIDTTIVLLALPTMTQSLNTTLLSSIWVILIYLLVIAVTTTQFGKLGDIYGRSKMFNLGFVIFTVGSLLCGLSPDILLLIIFRAIQGIGGSLLQANSGAIVADVFEPHKRGKAFGFVALGWSVGAMLGILLGGVLTTFVGWPSIFYINVPIGIVATYYAYKYINDTRRMESKIDWPGAVSLTASLLAISYGAINIAAVGISSLGLGLFILGVVLLVAFFLIEARSDHPLLNLKMFKQSRLLSYSLISSFFMGLGYFAVVFIIIMYLQGIKGLNPLDASLLLVPGYIISSLISPSMGRLSDKYGSRILATVGLVVLMAAVLIYFSLGLNSSIYIILLASFVSGIGAAMFFPANTSSIMSNAQAEHYGTVSGLSRLLQSLGILSSYVVSITVATLVVSRQTAFQIFIGTSKLIGGVSGDFLNGIHASLIVSLVLLLAAALFSALRGKEDRSKIRH